MSGPAAAGAAGHVVHTISGLKPRAGGVARSVPGLCEALARAGYRTTLISQKPAGVPIEELMLPRHERLALRLLPGIDLDSWRVSYTPRVRAALAAACDGACIVHDHGLWLHLNHAVAAGTRRLGVPRVVSPRGMLESWSLRYRGWKKRLAWRAYQRADLESVAAFSATSHSEAAAIREAGLRQPIAVIPNGIDVPASPPAHLRHGEPRVVLFMSRLHPKKGIVGLVEAWARVRPANWRLVIAGPDEDGHRRLVEQAIGRTGLGENVSLPGELEGDAKARVLASAQLFVLPSFSENFGIVVGEALAHGVPVIATRGTPWQILETEGCGWWIETGADALAAALRDATALDARQLQAMGARGRELVRREFSWDAVAARHIELYDWLAGRGPRPGWLS